jgi:hypothetical protein
MPLLSELVAFCATRCYKDLAPTEPSHFCRDNYGTRGAIQGDAQLQYSIGSECPDERDEDDDQVPGGSNKQPKSLVEIGG